MVLQTIFLFTLLLCSSVTTGLTWGGFDKGRIGTDWEITTTNFDTFRSIMSSHGAEISRDLVTTLTTEYMNNINAFWTGYVRDSFMTLSSAEQVVLHDWVYFRGGILLVGCNKNHYTGCRSFLEPFGFDVEGGHSSIGVVSDCSEQHFLLNGVDEMIHEHPQFLVAGNISTTPLCKLSTGELVVALLQSGTGYIIFSDFTLYHDVYISRSDNTQFIDNIISWTEQLACENFIGCPEVSLPPGMCDYGTIECGDVCTGITCDARAGCVCTPLHCDDGYACASDSCDPCAGGCVSTHVVCDDSNACTDEFCDPGLGCVSMPVDCDDGNVCTTDLCDELRGCIYVDCDDNNTCTTDSCDPGIGCIFTLVECDDNNVCTIDACDPTDGCVSTTSMVPCEDGDVCTLDFCDADYGCIHEDPQVCYPGITEATDRLKELQRSIQQIKDQIIPPAVPVSTSNPSPTQTQPPIHAFTLPPLATPPTFPPSSQPTTVPITVTDLVQEFLQTAIQDIQTTVQTTMQDVQSTIQDMQTTVQDMHQFIREENNNLNAKIQEQADRIRELQGNVAQIEDKVDILVSSLHPTPTQIPTSLPTGVPTLTPTREPALCKAFEVASRDDFLSSTGICLTAAQECWANTACAQALNEQNCNIPTEVLHGPEKCWERAGFQISVPDLPAGSADDTSFQLWVDLTLCVQRSCECTSEPGKWSSQELLEFTLTTSRFLCCLECHETVNCKKWHYLDQVCILLTEAASIEAVGASKDWTRGQLP